MSDDDDDEITQIARALDHAFARPVGRTGHYNRAGQPISFGEWVIRFENLAYRRVAETTTQSGAYVSTVWLGLDHRFGTGPPIIFESMVFDAGREDLLQERYTTEADALAGHARIVEQFGGAI